MCLCVCVCEGFGGSCRLFARLRALTLRWLWSHGGSDISCLPERCVAAMVSVLSEIHESVMMRGPSAPQPSPSPPQRAEEETVTKKVIISLFESTESAVQNFPRLVAIVTDRVWMLGWGRAAFSSSFPPCSSSLSLCLSHTHTRSHLQS